MGQTCCNEVLQDKNSLGLNNGGNKLKIEIEPGNHVNVKNQITPEIAATMNHAIQNEEKVIKI